MPRNNIAGGDLVLELAGALKMSPLPGEKVLADLPGGTEIRIEGLIFIEAVETNYLGVTGSLTAGPYANRQLELDVGFFTRDLISTIATTHGDPDAIATTWSVDPNMLEK